MLSRWIFVAFILAYFAVRAYWSPAADRRPVAESKSFPLDKLNIALVSICVLILPLLALFTGALSRFDYPAPPWLPLASIPLFASGLALFWMSHRDLGENWSVTLELKQNHALVTNGIYRRIRHPMYTSIWLCSLGQALCVPNYLGGLGILAAWGTLYATRIGREERMMLGKFGEAYRDYSARTARLFPLPRRR
jgi:protein-S-isoprenylcysteine O-methyltransferase Ste14